jgi:hypothetical protein
MDDSILSEGQYPRPPFLQGECGCENALTALSDEIGGEGTAGRVKGRSGVAKEWVGKEGIVTTFDCLD